MGQNVFHIVGPLFQVGSHFKRRAEVFHGGVVQRRLGLAVPHAAGSVTVGEFDLLFGPAYKGIPLVALSASALAEHHDIDTPYAFNRKEKKTHGEGGNIVGAPLEGKVLIVDECRRRGSLSEELFTALHEAKPGHYQIQRLCAEDSFIPLGAAAYTVLPSKQQIVQRALNMLGVPVNEVVK